MKVCRVLRQAGLPDEQGPHLQRGGIQWVPPSHSWGHHNIKTRQSSTVPNASDNTEPFLVEYDRSRMKAFMENRHHFFMYTRKIPEFWKNHRYGSKKGRVWGKGREGRLVGAWVFVKKNKKGDGVGLVVI